MSDLEDQEPEQNHTEGENGEDQAAEPETLIDILSGQPVAASAKNKLVQSVLRQLIETYGFDRNDLRSGYRFTSAGRRQKTVDIAILRHGTEALDENVERIVVCVIQKKREKLRAPQEADADLQPLREKMQLLANCTLGMWTNGQEEFFLKATETKFEVRFLPLGAWPAPGESTTDALAEGGATQVAADPENLGAALGRCFQYLNKNLGLDHKEAFRQLAVLMIAKLYDETRPVGGETLLGKRGRTLRDCRPDRHPGQNSGLCGGRQGMAARFVRAWLGPAYCRFGAVGTASFRAWAVLAIGDSPTQPLTRLSHHRSFHDGRSRGALPYADQRSGDGRRDAESWHRRPGIGLLDAEPGPSWP